MKSLRELEEMGWSLTPLGGGYAQIDGVMYTAYVVVTDEVTEGERDEYLRLFSHRPVLAGEATRWLQQWMRETKMKRPDIEELPGFEELFQKSMKAAIKAMPLEERLEGLAPEEVLGSFAPEQRLAGLAPEQRLAGLAPEQSVLAMPLEVLRVLPEDYLRSLPVEIQEQVRKRLHGVTH